MLAAGHLLAPVDLLVGGDVLALGVACGGRRRPCTSRVLPSLLAADRAAGELLAAGDLLAAVDRSPLGACSPPGTCSALRIRLPPPGTCSALGSRLPPSPLSTDGAVVRDSKKTQLAFSSGGIASSRGRQGNPTRVLHRRRGAESKDKVLGVGLLLVSGGETWADLQGGYPSGCRLTSGGSRPKSVGGSSWIELGTR
jgi:hypothetical protein